MLGYYEDPFEKTMREMKFVPKEWKHDPKTPSLSTLTFTDGVKVLSLDELKRHRDRNLQGCSIEILHCNMDLKRGWILNFKLSDWEGKIIPKFITNILSQVQLIRDLSNIYTAYLSLFIRVTISNVLFNILKFYCVGHYDKVVTHLLQSIRFKLIPL